MHLTTTLTTLLLTTLTLALPTTTPTTHNHKKKEPAAAVAAATCAHIHPLSTPRLNLLNRPDLGLLSTQTLTFDLPTTTPNSTTLPGPCTLRAVFPPHWTITDSSVQAGGPPLAVDVYAVDGPAAGGLVGTARFVGEVGSGVDVGVGGGERMVLVNSFACRPRMTYRFELVGVGEVGFVNGFDQGLGVDGGLEMTVGC